MKSNTPTPLYQSCGHLYHSLKPIFIVSLLLFFFPLGVKIDYHYLSVQKQKDNIFVLCHLAVNCLHLYLTETITDYF